MNTQEKIQKLKEFKNEREFREFLIDFLKKCGFKNVIHSHRYGSPEQGKDIIALYPHSLEGGDWYSFVVKLGRIGGGTNEIETIKNQIKQSFEYSYAGVNGNPISINKVKVVTNENFTSGGQSQISSSPELSLYNNFGFWWNEFLIEYIDKHYSDFWLPGDAFSKEYSKSFSKKLREEIEIRELSIQKIDDKKVKKLLEIFIDPKLTTNIVTENKVTKAKTAKKKQLKINNINPLSENILLSGEQGSGKSKVLNTIACNIADIESITKNNAIPVKLKASQIRQSNLDLNKAIENEIKTLSGPFFNLGLIKKYKIILFIDDLDLLKSDEREVLMDKIKTYCIENNTFYALTFRKTEFEYDKSIKKIQIHNFNSKQIEAFVSKFFDGTERGKKFIRILKESDILSKLPTTPLTITLISLLYDEKSYEIPATLSDIYTDFISVLLGKLEIQNKTDLLIFNIKRRLFSALALHMLDSNEFEIPYVDFESFINTFLIERGYQKQLKEELIEIIDKSGLLFLNDNDIVGFKQQSFVEFLASLEVYHHKRGSHYPKLVNRFNDVIWQNTAIFYAGHSKELDGMIDDVIAKSPNNNTRDLFINSGGMGYLAQALYLTKPSERKKLIIKSLDNLSDAFYSLKKLTKDKNNTFYKLPSPIILVISSFWFNENFKSVTLEKTLIEAFNDIYQLDNNFKNNLKLLMIATTLMNPYIDNDSCFSLLLDRKEFLDHRVLPIVANMVMEFGTINNNSVSNEQKQKVAKSISKKRNYIEALLKEPAYRFNDEFYLEK